MPLQAKGEFALVMEELEASLLLSGQPVKRGTMAHEHIIYMMLADCAAEAGDEMALQRYVPRLEALAQRDAHQPYLAIAHRARGVAHRLAGEYADAAVQLKQALTMFDDQGARFQLGRTLLELAALELAQSNATEAQAHFTRAKQLFEELGAAPYVTRVQAALAPLS